MSRGHYIVEFTPVLSTDAYTANDILFISTEIPKAIRIGRGAILKSLVVYDSDDEQADFDFFFTDEAITTAAVNAAEANTDAENQTILTAVSFVEADYVDLAAGQLGIQKESDPGMGVVLRPSDATQTSIWAFGIARDTPNFAAATDLLFKIGLELI